jgi:hypothetical protein
MNRTVLATVGMLAIAVVLIGTAGISIQTAAAAQATDLENSGTNSKFKEKEKNNCTGFTFCCNIATQNLGRLTVVPDCL